MDVSNGNDASPFGGATLEELLRATRTIGADTNLVLHGGGNSSAKTIWTSPSGDDVEVLWMKTSGSDMSTVSIGDFTPLSRSALFSLSAQNRTHQPVSDAEFQITLNRSQLGLGYASPSVESLVHVVLPHKFVLHSHADSIVTLTNTPNGRGYIRSALGPDFLICDYAMPGPLLGQAVGRLWAAEGTPECKGIVVLNHGLITFSDVAQEALEDHLQADSVARNLIIRATGMELSPVALNHRVQEGLSNAEIATLRSEVSRQAGRPVILRSVELPHMDLSVLASGPITPDHVNYVGFSADDSASSTEKDTAYIERLEGYRALGLPDEDLVPALSKTARVVVTDQHIHFVGRTSAEAVRALDITAHQLGSAFASMQLGGYTPASSEHVHDLEFWPPQLAKLTVGDTAKPLGGRIALVTGAASGIGRACAAELLNSGATVIGWDISASVTTSFDSPEWLGQIVNVTSREAQTAAIAEIVALFGGLDIVVVAAGVFPTAQHLVELEPAMWSKTMAINLESVVTLYSLIQPLLKHSPTFGRVCVVASKNFVAPGPGAAAYSASKAALTQISRVAALEWASDGIRVNVVHPDAVFDTALWTPDLLEKRATHYGMTVDAYKKRNLLKTEVSSRDVARLVRAMADDTFLVTTGAQVPIDGGNERVI